MTSRRQFLKVSALATVGLAAPTIVPAKVLGKNSPSNKITLGFIGVRNMGMTDLRNFIGRDQVQVVAVCDVDRRIAEEARLFVNQTYGNKDCQLYGDFREITRRSDIDAVVICTPDHWHTIPAIDAVKHEKDAYVEKPLTLTIDEGKALTAAVQRYDRVLQTGSMQRSMFTFRHAVELVRNGYIGSLKKIDVFLPGNNRFSEGAWTPDPVPAEFDYNFWLGPAPWKAYTEERCHYNFRFILDYSGGQVTNWGAHHLDIAQWALDMDDSGPVEIIGRGKFPEDGLFDTATVVDFDCLYDSGIFLTCKTDKSRNGVRFEGSDGWIYVDRGKILSSPASIAKQVIAPNESRVYFSNDHADNFLSCIKARRKPITNDMVGHRSATVCHLGNIAMLLRAHLIWDPQQQVFTNNDAANAMMSRAMRGEWRLEA
jgi:predicted dehydrogenase